MKTYGESRDELRNLQILKKMLENSSQFLSSKQPCGPTSLDVALNTAVVDKIRSENVRLRSTGGHSIRGLSERSISDGGNLCPLWLNRFEIVSETPLSCDTVGR